MEEFEKITEAPSHYHHLEQMTVQQILSGINQEDKSVPAVVEMALPQIKELVLAVTEKMRNGGRLFYIGSGTSGRLGVLDASECIPTYGIPPGMVIGIIAGGEQAVFKAVEFAEDDALAGWQDLEKYQVNHRDIVVGITASGTTPYVLGALSACRERNILTGSVYCNPGAPVSQISHYPVEVIVGPEFITGSTRMKSGTAAKLVLNMISTTVMIQLGRVEDNQMVNMQLTNEKLLSRGTKMLMDITGEKDAEKARRLLLDSGSVKAAVECWNKK